MEPREEEEQQNEKLLTELLESKQYTKLRQAAADMQAADIAAIMDDMEDEDSLKIFRILELQVDKPRYQTDKAGYK